MFSRPVLSLLVIFTARPIAAQTQLFQNPSFSTYTSSGGPSNWILGGDFWGGGGAGYTNYRTSPGYAAGGVYPNGHVSAGSAKDGAIGIMHQEVTIPANATSATLSFYYNVTSTETVAGRWDSMTVQVGKTDNSPAVKVLMVSNLDKVSSATSYTLKTFDMNAFIGSTVGILFTAISDVNSPTVFRIDDVNLNVTIPSCTYTLSSPANYNSGVNGGSSSFTVNTQSGCQWTASSNQTWISITSSTTGTNTSTISFSVGQNPSSIQRSGTITVQGQTYTITQPGQACSYQLSGSSVRYASGGANAFVSINSPDGCPWTASTTTPWLSLNSQFSNGTGNGNIYFDVLTNQTTSERTGSITIDGKILTVIQDGTPSISAITVGTTTFNFGDVQVNSSKRDSVEIVNTGNVTLTINAITYPNGYTADWSGGQIAVGNKRVVHITFAPTVTTTYSGSFNINSNASTNSSIAISLTGRGTVGQAFSLNPTQSHLRWPFKSPSSWDNRIDWYGSAFGESSGSGHGMDGHGKGDYYADDWNNSGPNKVKDPFYDCDLEFLSPLKGIVLYAKKDSGSDKQDCPRVNGCIIPTLTCGPSGFGNTVLIQSTDPKTLNYVFRVAHLNTVYVRTGQKVQIGTPIGKIGATGNSNITGPHVHAVLYKNVDQEDFIYGVKYIGINRLKDGSSLGVCSTKDTAAAAYCSGPADYQPNIFAADFKFDAISGGEGGGDEVSINYFGDNRSGYSFFMGGGSGKQVLVISDPELLPGSLDIIDLKGERMFTVRLSKIRDQMVEIGNLPPGIYVLRILGRAKNIQGRLVITQ